MIDSDIVVPGNLEESRLWFRVAINNDMPFNGTRLTPEEKGLLQQWILEMKRPVQRVISNEQILDLLVQDQRRSGTSNDFRYISFRHLADAGRTEAELKSYEGLINVHPQRPVPPRGTHPGRAGRRQAVNLPLPHLAARMGGRGLERGCPVLPILPPVNEVAAHQNLYDRLETEAPYLRGDWFIVNATQAPLYNRLVGPRSQPSGARGKAWSRHRPERRRRQREANRLRALRGVGSTTASSSATSCSTSEGETTSGGATTSRTGIEATDVRKNPLGPAVVVGDRFDNVFSQAGGEAIFSLPNRMQGYFLTDAIGTFLNEAPTVIVQDPRNRSQRRRSQRRRLLRLPWSDRYARAEGLRRHRSLRRTSTWRTSPGPRLTRYGRSTRRTAQTILPSDANRYLAALQAIGPSRH